MALLVVRCDDEALERIRAEALKRGLSLSSYARQRLGLTLERERASTRPRLRLRLSLAEHAALHRGAQDAGFANISAYVRARLFLLPPPPGPPRIPRHSSQRHPLRLVLSAGDDRRIAAAARAAKLRPIDYVMRRAFTEP